MADTFIGTEGAEELGGTSGDDIIYGLGECDNLYGNAGDDTLIGGAREDRLDGGAGNDKFVFVVGESGVDEIMPTLVSTDVDVIELVGELTIADVKFSADGNFGLAISYGPYGESVYIRDQFRADTPGNGGYYKVSTLIVGGVSYSLTGGLTFTGGNGYDAVFGTVYGDVLKGLGGDDFLDGGQGDDTIWGGTGTDVYFVGNYGNDRFMFAVGDGNDTVHLPPVTGERDVIEITGPLTLADVSFYGMGTDDLIIRYGPGDDQIGLPSFFRVAPADRVSVLVVGGVEYDLNALLADPNDLLTGTEGNDTLNGAAGDDTIFGLGGSDSLTGGDGNDSLDAGSGGHDTLDGGAGNDTLYGGSGERDVVRGGDGADTIYGGDGDLDTIFGGAGNDVIYDGGGIYDTIEGGDGNDTIYGGAGNDWYNGVYGDDLFVFDIGDGVDVVSNPSTPDTDVIEILGVAATDIRFEHFVVPGYPDQNYLKIFYGSGNDQVWISSHYLAEADPGHYYQTATLKVGSTIFDLRSGLPYTGTSGADIVRASMHNDTLSGLDGDDTMLAGAGNDALDGDAGNDLLNGGDGNDTLDGGAGSDTLDGENGDDLIKAGLSDFVSGGDGLDTVVIDAGTLTDVTFYGGLFSYNELFYYRDGVRDSIKLNGFEALNFTGNAVHAVFGGTGNDTLTGLSGDDFFEGVSGDDILNGGDGNDALNAGVGNDTIDGGAGVDIGAVSYVDRLGDLYLVNGGVAGVTYTATVGGVAAGTVRNVEMLYINGGFGNDTIGGTVVAGGYLGLSGGDGRDVAIVDASALTTAAFYGGLLAGYLENPGAGGSFVSLNTFERLDFTGNATNSYYGGVSGGNDDDSLTGLGGNDTFYGQLGNDSISGNGGADLLVGNGGADTISGGDGADQIWGEEGHDSLLGGARWDTIYGGDGNDTLDGGLDNDQMYGGLGDDVYHVDHVGDRVNESTTINEGSDTVYASISWNLSANVEAVVLTGSGDTSSTGNGLHNTMTGNAGNNTLSGGVSHDTMFGMDGNDSLDGGIDSDVLDGGNGNDTLLGGARWDTLTGGAGDDVLDGGAENDRMSGGAGNDVYYIDHTGDRALEVAGEGTDLVISAIDHVLWADVENLTLTGGAVSGTGNSQANVLTGSANANVLAGGNGNDTLKGGAGNDSLTGGGHADDFVFEAAGVNGTDTLADFVHGTDRLVFTGADYGFAAGHVLTAAQFTVGSAPVGAGAQFVLDPATGRLWWDADGTGFGAAVNLALFDGGATVTKDDLVFV
ncbi:MULTISPECIES: calcium-binding protein [Asticcacaulis]|uniref:calcium-binding protein n=1 Tax=Asticcacaulis TaxID=76890 RepID=UPI001AE7B356|nr:calcium-binding protein [Asticcacaulis sp. BE141]MBP2160300.1 Ca2+-binding RTX toxin-like protein [Asticcacaulis solisilvae]MDR6801397.1 Ca2+-binding RTX toxin-like protein [Asticcacaulis sp. BE141]